MVIIWRIREKICGNVLCYIVKCTCTQSFTHTQAVFADELAFHFRLVFRPRNGSPSANNVFLGVVVVVVYVVISTKAFSF